jgi:ABC-type multidrug transport system fused ATPase/permease subunit
MSYARAAEHGRPVRILGHGFHIGSDLRSLLVFGAIVAGLGLLSAACTYVTDRLIIALARDYQALCAGRVLAIAGDPLCRGWQASADETPRAIISRLAGSASRAMGLVLRDMLRVILPVLTVVATVGFLFYIDVPMTLLLLPFAAAYMLPLYLINRRVTRLQRQYRELSPRARSEVSRRVRHMLSTGEFEQGTAAAQREAIDGPVYRGSLAALYGRLLADRRVHLLNSAFFVTCLVALLIGFGIEARSHGRAWSDLLFYLLALRFAISSLKQTTSMGAKFSRFFPEYRAYSNFVKDSKHTRERREAALANPQPAADSLALRLGRQTMWNSARAVNVGAGDIAWVFWPFSPGHADLEAVAVRIERRLGDDVDFATRAVFVARAETLDALDRKPNQLSSAVFLTGDVAARPRGQRWLEQERRGLRRPVFILHTDPHALLAPEARQPPPAAVLVMDVSRFIGGGDMNWLRSNAATITAFLTQQAEMSRHRGSGEDSLDDDDDDEDDE